MTFLTDDEVKHLTGKTRWSAQVRALATVLPKRYNDTYHLTGDVVVVPAVSWLEQHILRPVAVSAQRVVMRKQPKEKIRG